MGLVWSTFPDVDPEDQKYLKFPKDINDTKQLGNVLSRYKDQYYAQVKLFTITPSWGISVIHGGWQKKHENYSPTQCKLSWDCKRDFRKWN